MDNNFNSGFIAIIGRPNVGKSTFMNQMIGQKIAVMSDKAQTTRNKIQGVRTEEHSQIVFIDTPGIHKPKHRLGDFMVQTAEDTLNEVDAVLFLIDAKAGYGRGDQYIIDRLQQVKKPVFLILNKIDLIEKENLLLLMDSYKEKYNFTEIIPVSALEGENVHYLLQVLKTHLPEGPQYYPEDQITDHPERFIMEELLREKVLQLTHEEIPHSIAVTIDHLEKRASNAVYVQAVVIAERSSQKGILIGKNGSMLKEIGKRAREEMESLLGTNAYLDLWVKIQKDWRNRQNQLRALGFREEEY